MAVQSYACRFYKSQPKKTRLIPVGLLKKVKSSQAVAIFWFKFCPSWTTSAYIYIWSPAFSEMRKKTDFFFSPHDIWHDSGDKGARLNMFAVNHW